MRNIIYCISIISIQSLTCVAQSTNASKVDTINNLVLPVNYETSEYGAIPSYTKAGKGKKTLILIPGLGFDKSVFNDFINSNKKQYVMYVITVAGFGDTSAPPMPGQATSYGEQNWSKGAMLGIKKLIEKEDLIKPIIVGHFTLGTQLGILLALNYPNDVGGLIILGGPGRFVPIQNGKIIDYPLKTRIMVVDTYSAPYFKGVTKAFWDAGNYASTLYSLKPEVGDKLWSQVANVPMPVMIQYLLEFQACDLLLEANKIQCPMLIIRPRFKTEMLSHSDDSNLNYIKPQFIDSWNSVLNQSPNIEIQDIPNSGVFLWKDQPNVINRVVKEFVKRNT